MKIHSNKRMKSVLSAVTARMLDKHIIYIHTNGDVLLLCSTAFSNLAKIIGSDSKKQDWGLYSLNEGFMVTLFLTIRRLRAEPPMHILYY